MARRRAVAVAAPSRFPTEFVLKLIRGLLILGLVLVIVLAGAGSVLTYLIVTARNDIENVTPNSFLLSNFENVNFRDAAGTEHEGWLLLGLKGAPVIIMCHGYNSNRSELLPLGTALRENHFNVYLYNFAGSKGNPAFNNLGVAQANILQSAINAMTKHANVNPRRVGVFGANTGGFAALIAAEQSPLVKAIVVDSAYLDHDQMFDAQIERLLGGSSPLFQIVAETEFHLFTLGTKSPAARENLQKLAGMPKLFISGRDTPLLARASEDLYNLAPQPKRLLVFEHGQASLASDAEKKEYETQVLSFFLQDLALRAD